MPLASLLVGIAMLVFGRRLFWIFVAGTGFAVAAYATVEWLGALSDVWVIAIACAAGVAGALLALLAQRLAVSLAGFLAGAYLGNAIAGAVPLDMPLWIPVVIGGILGTLVLAFLLDWALIAMSSLLGAAMIAQSTPLVRPWPSVIFVLLVITGLAIQARQFVRRKSKPAPKAEKK